MENGKKTNGINELRQVNIKLPLERLKNIRKLAIDDDINVSEFINRSLIFYVRNRDKGELTSNNNAI